MKKNIRPLIYLLIGGFLFCFDQLLKYFARINFDYTYYLWRPWLGWEYYGNTGIAFSLPIPNWLVVIVTPVVLLGLIYWLVKIFKKNIVGYELLALCLIILGAISNYIDRVLFGVTIDYLRVLTGIFNLADLMVVAGVVILILGMKEKKL